MAGSVHRNGHCTVAGPVYQAAWSTGQTGREGASFVSIAAMNWAWHQKLKPVPKLVLMALADAADDIGVCWPRVSTVAAKCNVSTRTVRRVMQTLAAQGLLVSEQRYRKDGSCSSNRYRLLLAGGDNLSPAPVAAVSTPGHPSPGDPDTRVIARTTRRTQTESPQPQASSTEPGVPAAAERGGGNLFTLEYPKGLVNAEREGARRHLEDLPVDLAQQLLDELSAHMGAGTIRVSPLAYLRGLVKRARAGEFEPEAGLQVAENRTRRAHAEAAKRRAEAAGRDFLANHLPIVEGPLAERLVDIRNRARRDPSNPG